MHCVYIYISYNKMAKDNRFILHRLASRLFRKFGIGVLLYIFPKISMCLHSLLTAYDTLELRMSISELDAYIDDVSASLKRMNDMTFQLQKLKREKSIKYIEDEEGNMSIDVPNKMSDQEADNLSKRVQVIDRIYNTEQAKFKKLISEDHAKILEDSVHRQYNTFSSKYKSLFEKEK